MRISDWSSDVCSSDLGLVEAGHRREVEIGRRLVEHRGRHVARIALRRQAPEEVAGDHRENEDGQQEQQTADHRAVNPAELTPSPGAWRSEAHTSALQSLMRISYAVFGLKKKKNTS